MKITNLITICVASFLATSILNAVNVIQVNSITGGAFDNLYDSTTVPLDNTSIGADTDILDSTYFKTAFISGIGNRDTYKAGAIDSTTTSVSGWADSFNEQTFTLNVTSLAANTPGGTSVGPRWRYYRTYANGSTNLGAVTDLSLGANSITIASVASPASGWTGRQVGILIEGVVRFDSFEHDYGSGVDSFSVVPEPSTYALLAGFAAFLFVAIKRRK